MVKEYIGDDIAKNKTETLQNHNCENLKIEVCICEFAHLRSFSVSLRSCIRSLKEQQFDHP